MPYRARRASISESPSTGTYQGCRLCSYGYTLAIARSHLASLRSGEPVSGRLPQRGVSRCFLLRPFLEHRSEFSAEEHRERGQVEP